MEVLRYYIHHDDYKSALLVSKTWKDYLLDTQGAMMFARAMTKGGYIICYKKHVDILKGLRGISIIKILAETFENLEKSKKDCNLFFKKYTYPMTYIMSRRIKKRPNLYAIDLMGH